MFSLTIYGSKGYASINPFKIQQKIGDQFIDLTPSHSDSAASLFKKSYLNELKSFIGAVRGLNPLFSSGEETLSRMKVIDAMYKSSSRKTEIKI